VLVRSCVILRASPMPAQARHASITFHRHAATASIINYKCKEDQQRPERISCDRMNITHWCSAERRL
jgi:hypothetical protein